MEQLEKIYLRYQKLRDEGLNARESLEQLLSHIESLSKEDKTRLRERIRTWERNITRPVTTMEMRAMVEIEDPHLVGAPDNITLQELQESVQQLESNWVACPTCGEKNRDYDARCFSCGTKLLNNPHKPDTQLFASAGAEVYSQDYYGSDSVLVLELRNTVGRFEIRPQVKADGITLGRTTGDRSKVPNIDLSRVGGDEYGVSRLHLVIQYDKSARQLNVMDLGSSNGTFVNDKRLIQNIPSLLKNGDKLRLGRMIIQISYMHPGEEIN